MSGRRASDVSVRLALMIALLLITHCRGREDHGRVEKLVPLGRLSTSEYVERNWGDGAREEAEHARCVETPGRKLTAGPDQAPDDCDKKKM